MSSTLKKTGILGRLCRTLGIIGMLSPAMTGAAEVPQPGAPAPAFTLPDQAGKMHSLKDYSGQWVVLYFYPKDDTPGCTQEACSFRDDQHRLASLGVKILGVSLDGQQSHARFAEKYKLPFPLLSDEQGEVTDRYGALIGMGPVKFARRYTFVIDPKGTIRKNYLDVDTQKHAQEIIQDVSGLQKAG